MNNYTVFEYVFNDEQLEENFEKQIQSLNIEPIFTYEHRSTPIKVNWAEARSIVNGTSYYQTFAKFSDYVHMNVDNKSYDNALFKLLYSSNTIQGMVNIMKRIMDVHDNADENRKHNTWNIVYYTENVY